jgi:5-methylcytosine-specific restriction endonuclease McrA
MQVSPEESKTDSYVVKKKTPRKSISKSVKNNMWIQHYGEKFSVQCSVEWCVTIITPFTFEVGHNVPHSKSGTIDIDNLKPICGTCNKSMGNRFTIDEFSKIAIPRKQHKKKLVCGKKKVAAIPDRTCCIL